MLVLARKPGESIIITLKEGIDPETPVGKLFGRSRRPASRDTRTSMYSEPGPIEILVAHIGRSEVKIAIQAHPDLLILRNELNDSD